MMGIWLGLIVLGYFCGRAAEAKHYRSIHAREKTWLHLPSTSLKTLLDPARPVERSELVYGNMVVSIDYFKQAVAGLRSLIGGAVKSHETLIDRARREAVLRLKESCPDAHEIVNLRLETMSISGKMPGSVTSVEVLAYGTAIYFAK
ncbi:YbjQ family protein [Massilia scottii]|uniref:YbjQ family protein n=1 Tax=Massilia scottii TaxID=3057166 RepID=UPI002796D5CE|nr:MULTISPECIES: heavy metal-binding domain-containing protein [unclassified Massilia]MDQ1816337.1 heavy metal-binding domain-containing protein [Massilia sp. CCM 9210]MDQ1831806.1 heavy metal-binding domain-containing protein [Massilia sp. CCM 9029]